MNRRQLQARINELEAEISELRKGVGRIDAHWGSFDECAEFIAERLPADDVVLVPAQTNFLAVLKWREGALG